MPNSRKLKTYWSALDKKGLVPLLTVLTVNNRCNSHCPYCFVNKKRYPDTPIANLKDAINELADLGCYEVTIQGGEALLRDDIGDIFEHVRSRDLRLHLVTNGKNILERQAEVRLLDAVHVSIDGDEEYNRQTKNDSDYFHKAVEGIRHLRSQKINCSLNALLLKGVSTQIPFLLNLARELGVAVQFINPIKTDYEKINDKFLISDQEFEKAVGMILEAKKRGELVLPSLNAMKWALTWKQRYDQSFSDVSVVAGRDLSPNPCFAGRKFIFIDYQGYLSPCCIRQEKNFNVYEIGILEAMKRVSAANRCYDCINFPFIDMNLIFNYDIGTLFNYVVRMMKYR